MKSGGPRPIPVILLLACALAGCQALLDDHPKVDIDYCGDYTGNDECCAEGDPCDLAGNQQCDCDGCDWDLDDCTMQWTFTDLCDDFEAIHVELYQVGVNGLFDEGEKKWDSLDLEAYGEPGTIEIRCTEGEKVCYGAWSESANWLWGCAENCLQYCENCCYYCDHQDQVSLQLGC